MTAAHDAIAATWIEWEFEEGVSKLVLVVATWLELDSSKPGFSGSETDEVIEAAIKANALSTATRLRLVPAQRYDLSE